MALKYRNMCTNGTDTNTCTIATALSFVEVWTVVEFDVNNGAQILTLIQPHSFFPFLSSPLTNNRIDSLLDLISMWSEHILPTISEQQALIYFEANNFA